MGGSLVQLFLLDSGQLIPAFLDEILGEGLAFRFELRNKCGLELEVTAERALGSAVAVVENC